MAPASPRDVVCARHKLALSDVGAVCRAHSVAVVISWHAGCERCLGAVHEAARATVREIKTALSATTRNAAKVKEADLMLSEL
jgi:hypothetical protein